CKRDVDPVEPGNGGAGVDFYLTSGVFKNYAVGKNIIIDVDNYIPHPTGQTLTSYPNFYINSDLVDFPGSSDNIFQYVRYNAGKHRFMLTDTTNTIVADTTLNLAPKSYSTIYYADGLTAPNAPAVYRTVIAQESRNAAPAGKIGVRFVDLSADAGALSVYLQNASGGSANLASGLNFLKVTDYQYLDSTAVVSGLVRFTVSNSSGSVALPTGVTFASGAK